MDFLRYVVLLNEVGNLRFFFEVQGSFWFCFSFLVISCKYVNKLLFYSIINIFMFVYYKDGDFFKIVSLNKFYFFLVYC